MMAFQQALDETLKDLGFQSLKLKQKEAVEAVGKGRDVFVALPTGYGMCINLCHLANFVQ